MLSKTLTQLYQNLKTFSYLAHLADFTPLQSTDAW